MRRSLKATSFTLLVVTTLLACDDGGDAQATARDASTLDAGRGDARIDAETRDAKPDQRDGESAACDVPAACVDVETAVVRFERCCAADQGCGLRPADATSIATFQASLSEDLNEPGACIARTKFTGKSPTLEEERVPNPDGTDIYISTECETSGLLSLPFRGCCLPSGRCGVSSYPVHGTLGVLLGDTSPGFTRLECVSSDVMNEQLRATALAGFGEIPGTDAPCDYDALVARLKP